MRNIPLDPSERDLNQEEKPRTVKQLKDALERNLGIPIEIGTMTRGILMTTSADDISASYDAILGAAQGPDSRISPKEFLSSCGIRSLVIGMRETGVKNGIVYVSKSDLAHIKIETKRDEMAGKIIDGLSPLVPQPKPNEQIPEMPREGGPDPEETPHVEFGSGDVPPGGIPPEPEPEETGYKPPELPPSPRLPFEQAELLERTRSTYARSYATFENTYLSRIPAEKISELDEIAMAAEDKDDADIRPRDTELIQMLRDDYAWQVEHNVMPLPNISGFDDYAKKLAASEQLLRPEDRGPLNTQVDDKTKLEAYASQQKFMKTAAEKLGIPFTGRNKDLLLALYHRQAFCINYIYDKRSIAEETGAAFRRIVDQDYPNGITRGGIPGLVEAEKQGLVDGWVADRLIIQDRIDLLLELQRMDVANRNECVDIQTQLLYDAERNPNFKAMLVDAVKEVYQEGGIEKAHGEFTKFMTRETLAVLEEMAEREKQRAAQEDEDFLLQEADRIMAEIRERENELIVAKALKRIQTKRKIKKWVRRTAIVAALGSIMLGGVGIKWSIDENRRRARAEQTAQETASGSLLSYKFSEYYYKNSALTKTAIEATKAKAEKELAAKYGSKPATESAGRAQWDYVVGNYEDIADIDSTAALLDAFVTEEKTTLEELLDNARSDEERTELNASLDALEAFVAGYKQRLQKRKESRNEELVGSQRVLDAIMNQLKNPDKATQGKTSGTPEVKPAQTPENETELDKAIRQTKDAIEKPSPFKNPSKKK